MFFLFYETGFVQLSLEILLPPALQSWNCEYKSHSQLLCTYLFSKGNNSFLGWESGFKLAACFPGMYGWSPGFHSQSRREESCSGGGEHTAVIPDLGDGGKRIRKLRLLLVK